MSPTGPQRVSGHYQGSATAPTISVSLALRMLCCSDKTVHHLIEEGSIAMPGA
jgi:hypothetical protein